MSSTSPDPRATFAVILTWPDVKNAEYEVVQRLCIAASNIGARATVVDNDGYPIWSTFKNVDKSDPRIDRSEYDFVISLHFESPRLFDLYSYAALWNPSDFYFIFGYEKSSMKLVSHNDALSCGSDLADNHALNLLRGLGRPVTDLPKLYHAPPEPYLRPNITEDAKLFYIGINWEKLGGPKGRHHDLLQSLEEDNLIAIYGPDLFQGGRPWEGFKTYQGPIPFDGKSVVKQLHEAGICLALSSKSHQQSGIMSNRLFEGLAAGAVVIANQHPIIEKYFSDCVYVIDDSHLEPRELSDLVRGIILEIRRNPQEGQRRAVIGQQRLAEIFSLERSLETLIDQHHDRTIRSKSIYNVPANQSITVVLVYTQTNCRDFKSILENVLRQSGVSIDLVCICDQRLAGELTTLLENEGAELRSVRVEAREFYSLADFHTRTARRLCSTGSVLHSVLADIGTEYFALLGREDHWFSDHLASLVAALIRTPQARMAASGLLVEDAAPNGRTERRIEELAFTQHEALLNVAGIGCGGRFAFCKDVSRLVHAETMALLDGEEINLFALEAVLSGPICQTNYGTYVSLEHERWKRPQPLVPPEQQYQFIRDSVVGDQSWQAMRAHAVPVSATPSASQGGLGLRWERYALPTAAAPLLQPNKLYHLSTAGNGLRYLGKGFSRPEAQHVWIEEDVADIVFQLPEHRDKLSLQLTCWARPSQAAPQRQGFTITVNDLPVAYTEVDQDRKTLRFPLPPKLIDAGDDFKIAIVPDYPEQIKNGSGVVVDPRRLSVALSDFALISAAPSIKLDQILETKVGGAGVPLLIDGFEKPEPEAIWFNGTRGSFAFQIDGEVDDALELVLVFSGRASRDGQLQRCTIIVNGTSCGEAVLSGFCQQVAVPLPPVGYSNATWHVEVEFAFAEPIFAADGSISDARTLTSYLHSITARRMVSR